MTKAVAAMLEDGKRLNRALSTVKRDFASEEPLLVEKMRMESDLHQKIEAWLHRPGRAGGDTMDLSGLCSRL